jgi:hypothetical protein
LQSGTWHLVLLQLLLVAFVTEAEAELQGTGLSQVQLRLCWLCLCFAPDYSR